MVAATFDYHAPATLRDAVSLLNDNADAKVLAGGHSLIPMMKLRLSEPSVVIDLGRVDGLSYVNESGGALAIGAMTSYYDIINSDAVQQNAPVLAEAAGEVADPQVRNMGTIGGSLAHSDPAADLPAVMLALDAEVVASSRGALGRVSTRTISADDFFVDLFTTALEPNEILTEIRIPAQSRQLRRGLREDGQQGVALRDSRRGGVRDRRGRQRNSRADRRDRLRFERVARLRLRGPARGKLRRRRRDSQRSRQSGQRYRAQRGHPRIRRVPRASDQGLRPARHHSRRGASLRLDNRPLKQHQPQGAATVAPCFIEVGRPMNRWSPDSGFRPSPERRLGRMMGPTKADR